MADPRQLLGRRHARRAGTHHGNPLTGLVLGGTCRHPTLGPGAVNDGVLDGFDAHRFIIHIQGASRLAGCWTDTARELGEIIGAVQHINRVFPIPLKHQIIEIRNDVVHRATAVAKRCAAVHAAGCLHLGLCVV